MGSLWRWAAESIFICIAPAISLRLVEAGYLLTRFDSVAGASATQNGVRISTGIVFRFGNR